MLNLPITGVLTRRRAVAGLAASCGVRPSWALPVALPDEATLLVAGPAGGRADRWAELLSPALGRSLQQAGALPRQNVGGSDGVTGANQFEARAAPDGSTALLVPGSAALLWLAGDTRVRFDAARWLPVWAGSTSAAVASRVRLVPGRPVRIAVSKLVGPELAALLALHLMGIEAIPVPVTAIDASVMLRSDVDAIFLHGSALRTEAGVLAASGMALAFGFGALNVAGETVRDPAFPDLLLSQEMIARMPADPSPELASALRAVTAAMQLDLALILPQLSPAAVVAWWRRGCAALAQAPDIQAEAARSSTRPVNPQSASISTAAIAADVSVLLALRRWLEERYQWRPA